MMTKKIQLSVIFVFLLNISNTKVFAQINKVHADSLIKNISFYENKKVETEGLIIHICSVDGKKMKLKTESGAIIKIVPQDSSTSFNDSLYNKRVRIYGIVKEFRIEQPEMDKMEKDKNLLCHIDHTPCKDSAWVNGKKKAGIADSLSKKDIQELKTNMEQTHKNYISVITIFAEKYDIIEEEKK